MQRMNKNFMKRIYLLIPFLLIGSVLFAQHRGDNLSLQGLSSKNDVSVKAAAMGGAFTAVTGDMASLFFNPAALVKLKQIQVSVSANYFSKQWRENQNYRPDRYFVTLPFYLEGLYIPDPANNGKWDYQLAQDTLYNYNVKEPELGLDSYSEEAADWKNDKDDMGFNSFTIAVPFELGGQKFAAAASFNRNNNFYDYDRNDTYLDPHIGYYGYPGDITRVDGIHTLTMYWSRFMRERAGAINTINGALSYELNEMISLGAGFKTMWGESDDIQSLTRVGSFLLSNQQRFAFSYETASKTKAGVSDYSSTSFNLSALVELNRFRIGLKVELPYTLTREWNYTETVKDSMTVTNSISGKDEVELPAIFNIGFSFQPVDAFIIDFDYEYAPYKKAKFNLGSTDDTFQNWVNQNTISFGLEFKATKYLSLLAGYRSIPQTYVPDGAAITDKGPDANSYNCGVSVSLFFGRIDLAYELRILKYYDSYFSNTNYAFEKSSNIMIGYTYTF